MKKYTLFIAALMLAVFAASPQAWALVPWEGVRIDEVHFPDETFRNYVLANFDTNGDGILSKDPEVPPAKIVSLNSSNLSSLDGIKYLECLEELYCADNPDMRYLDVSELGCLKKLDIANNTGFETVNVSGTKIWELNLDFGLEKLRTVYATNYRRLCV